MARYDFQCPHGHVTELVQAMADETPETIPCGGAFDAIELLVDQVTDDVGQPLADRDAYACAATAARIFTPPAAIHFNAPGFYATDYKGRYDRKRRKMPSDDLPNYGDSDTHRVFG